MCRSCLVGLDDGGGVEGCGWTDEMMEMYMNIDVMCL